MNSLHRTDKNVLWYTMTTNRCLLLKLFIALCLQVKIRQTYWCKSAGIFPKKCGNLEQLSLLFKNTWPDLFKYDIFWSIDIYLEFQKSCTKDILNMETLLLWTLCISVKIKTKFEMCVLQRLEPQCRLVSSLVNNYEVSLNSKRLA